MTSITLLHIGAIGGIRTFENLRIRIDFFGFFRIFLLFANSSPIPRVSQQIQTTFFGSSFPPPMRPFSFHFIRFYTQISYVKQSSTYFCVCFDCIFNIIQILSIDVFHMDTQSGCNRIEVIRCTGINIITTDHMVT